MLSGFSSSACSRNSLVRIEGGGAVWVNRQLEIDGSMGREGETTDLI